MERNMALLVGQDAAADVAAERIRGMVAQDAVVLEGDDFGHH